MEAANPLFLNALPELHNWLASLSLELSLQPRFALQVLYALMVCVAWHLKIAILFHRVLTQRPSVVGTEDVMPLQQAAPQQLPARTNQPQDARMGYAERSAWTTMAVLCRSLSCAPGAL